MAQWGVEGEHWEYKAESKSPSFIKADDGFSYEDVGGGSMWVPNGPFEFQNKRASAVKMDWMYENEMDKYGINSQLMAPLPSAIKYQEELKKIQEEAFISIITGDKPLSYYDEYMDKWWTSGGEILSKEANAWYSSLK
ncbi:MAG: hypothetical protein OCD02_06580 [Spirochaetaceae bacterium]